MNRLRLMAVLVSSWAALGSVSSNAATVDGQPSFDRSKDKGIYVWRQGVDSNTWQIRQVSGGSNGDSFDGRFESSGSLGSLKKVALDSPDSAVVSSGNSLTVEFNVKNTDVDGAKFDIGSGSELCLRSLGGATTVFLGENAVPAQTPVALLGANACSSTADPAGDGLYISQDNNGRWMVRLTSNEATAKFAGQFEATQPFDSVNPISIENNDEVALQSPDTLYVDVRAYTGGYDGVDFSLPGGSGICLRDSNDGATTVYLGTDPSNAIPVTTPVDLTNSGACDSSTIDPPPPPAAGRKFNPGHYTRLMRCCQSDKTINESIKPGVVGFMKRYTWRQLEPQKGVYDLSAIATDLDFLSSKGMQLIAMIEDKTFVNEQPLPQYLASLTVRNRQNGFTAVRWHPTVVDRMGKLFAAIGENFDSNPFFEGVALMESAPSVDNDLLDSTGYTPEKYRDALIDVMIAGAEGMPTSRVFWYMNYLPRKRAYLADVASAVAPYGIVMGGPDVMPDNQSLVSGTYPLYDQFAGQMPLFGQVEPICYSHPHADTSYPTKYWTMPELFKYARDNLNVNYMIWVRYPRSDYSDSYDWFDALPVMKNNPVFNQ